MSARFPLASSICDAAGWYRPLILDALAGKSVPEIDERLAYLKVETGEHQAVLELAADLCAAISQAERTEIRIVASRPSLADVGGVWGLGQEWLEIIRRARAEIVVISPSMDAGAITNLREALATAYAEGVRVTVLFGALGRADRLRAAIGILISTCPRAELLEWPNEQGFLHAKVICADNKIVYVGSANLTEFGWEKNVELGLTLSGPSAQPLLRYCSGLIEIAREAHLKSATETSLRLVVL